MNLKLVSNEVSHVFCNFTKRNKAFLIDVVFIVGVFSISKTTHLAMNSTANYLVNTMMLGRMQLQVIDKVDINSCLTKF